MFLFALHSVFCCLAVYLIGGFLYQRLVVGAKGVEQFPNYAFWSEIGNLSAVSIVTYTFVSVYPQFWSLIFYFMNQFYFFYPNRTDVILSAVPVATEKKRPHIEA